MRKSECGRGKRQKQRMWEGEKVGVWKVREHIRNMSREKDIFLSKVTE